MTSRPDSPLSTEPGESPERIPVRIERLVFQGDGLGRLPDGRVVFVPGGAPGDLVEVRLLPGRRDFTRGEIRRLLEPSPLRTAPPCRYFGTCGGCQWQHLTAAGQLAWKAEMLRELFVRIAKLPDAPVAPPVAPLSPLGYRGRAQFKVAPAQPGTRVRLGFHQRESHRVVEMGSCPLLHPALNSLLGALRRMRTPDLVRLFPGLGEVWAAVGTGTGEALVTLFARSGERAALHLVAHRLAEAVPGLVGVVLMQGDPRHQPRFLDRHGRGALIEQVGSFRFRVDATAFFQVSGQAAEALTALALEAAGLTGRERVLDLYCGVGTFTLPLARRAGEVVGVEAHPAAAADAAHNAREHGCGNVRIVRGQAERVLPDLCEGGVDLVVLDPPRQGVERGLLEALATLAAPRIVYVSCDPSTLARDVGFLARQGYACVRLTPVDLFPQTFHLETVALLERREPR